jgi:hypothetical protein
MAGRKAKSRQIDTRVVIVSSEFLKWNAETKNGIFACREVVSLDSVINWLESRASACF